ncbi:MAG TPA: DUF5678 domain-containing protein [Candidatus Bilamarchaeaceae archaeon]|nr:DUF5678 domain-containing protein [Candidatus Bilamarchaeaceae archaeon]
MTSKEFQFYLKADFHKYEGKYVAIVDEKVVASGDTVTAVWEEARKKTGKEPYIAKIPTEDTLILVLRCKK